MIVSKKRFQELENKVKTFEQKYCQLVDFLAKNNKDDLAKEYYPRCGSVAYIYNGELKHCELPYLMRDIKTVENKEISAIIELSNLSGSKTFWKLDKYKNVMVDITTEYREKGEGENK